MVDEIGRARGNEDGHWERRELTRFHDEILSHLDRPYFGAGRYSPLHDFPLPTGWWAKPEIRHIRLRMEDFLQARMRPRELFGFKDPRTMRLLPVWNQIYKNLLLEPKYIVCVRNPAHVAASLQTRDEIPTKAGEYKWLVYNADCFQYVGGQCMVIDYDDWFLKGENTLERLTNFLRPLDATLGSDNDVLSIVDNQLNHGGALTRRSSNRMVDYFYGLIKDAPERDEIRSKRDSFVEQFNLFQRLLPFDLSLTDLTQSSNESLVKLADFEVARKTLTEEKAVLNRKLAHSRGAHERAEAAWAEAAAKLAESEAAVKTQAEEKAILNRKLADSRGAQERSEAARAETAARLAESEAALKALAEEKAVLNRKLADSRGAQERSEAARAETAARLAESEAALKAQGEEKAILNRKLADSRGAQERSEAARAEAAVRLAESEAAHAAAHGATIKLQQDSADLRALLDQSEAVRAGLAEGVAASLGRHADLVAQLEQVSADYATLSLNAAELQHDRDRLVHIVDRLQDEARDEGAAVAALKREIEECAAREILLKHQLSQLAAELMRAHESGEHLNARIRSSDAACRSAQEALEIATARLRRSEGYARERDDAVAAAAALRTSLLEPERDRSDPAYLDGPQAEGGLLGLQGDTLVGWAAYPGYPEHCVIVEAEMEGRFALTAFAARPLREPLSANIPHLSCGFEIELSRLPFGPSARQLRLRFAANGATLPGSPVLIRKDDTGFEIVAAELAPRSSSQAEAGREDAKSRGVSDAMLAQDVSSHLKVQGGREAFPGHSGLDAPKPDPDDEAKAALSAVKKSGDYAAWVDLYDTATKADLAKIRGRLPEMSVGRISVLLLGEEEASATAVARTARSICDQVYDDVEFVHSGPAPIGCDVPSCRVATGDLGDMLARASGNWAVFVAAGDVLAPTALATAAAFLTSHPEATFIFTDEDRIDDVGRRSEPYFKGGWDPDLACAQDHICRAAFVQMAAARPLATGEPPTVAGLYRALLRLAASAGGSRVLRCPFVLYHRAEDMMSTEDDEDRTERAIVGLLSGDGSGPAPKVLRPGAGPRWIAWTMPTTRPSVSAIIPTRDQVDLLRACVSGLRERTSYGPIEIVVVDNESREAETISYLDELRVQGVTVLAGGGPFNFAALNNLGVAKSSGQLVLLLNNDIVVDRSDWLDEMIVHALRPDVGAVGAKLRYADGTIQHAGVTLGIGGVASHIFKRLPDGSPGYHQRLLCAQEYSAVTAACMLVRREVWEQVGGLDLAFPVAFNDVDLCLRIRGAGFRILWTPAASLYHHESASRGHEDNPEKRSRFEADKARMLRRWGAVIADDPFYNPNLSFSSTACLPAFPPRVASLAMSARELEPTSSSGPDRPMSQKG